MAMNHQYLSHNPVVERLYVHAKIKQPSRPKRTRQINIGSCCRFFDEISQDTGKFVFGVGDTLQCLEMGAVETLIVWENLEVSSKCLLCITRARDLGL